MPAGSYDKLIFVYPAFRDYLESVAKMRLIAKQGKGQRLGKDAELTALFETLNPTKRKLLARAEKKAGPTREATRKALATHKALGARASHADAAGAADAGAAGGSGHGGAGGGGGDTMRRVRGQLSLRARKGGGGDRRLSSIEEADREEVARLSMAHLVQTPPRACPPGAGGAAARGGGGGGAPAGAAGTLTPAPAGAAAVGTLEA